MSENNPEYSRQFSVLEVEDFEQVYEEKAMGLKSKASKATIPLHKQRISTRLPVRCSKIRECKASVQ